MPVLYPLARRVSSANFRPNIHWAQFQQALATKGTFRRILDYELFYILIGEILVHFEDADQPIRAVSGDLLLLPPATAHRIELLTEPSTLLLGIHFDFFHEVEAPAEQDLVIRDPEPVPERFCRIPVQEDGSPMFERFYPSIPQEASDCVQRVVKEYGSTTPGSSMASHGLLQLFLALLLRLQHRHSRQAHPEYWAEVQTIVKQMTDSPGSYRGNAAIAKRLGVSEDHFIRLFSEIVGVSPNKFLQQVKHHEAKRLLRESSLPIERIGQQLGYEQLANFSKSFKKWQGISPSEYRRIGILY